MASQSMKRLPLGLYVAAVIIVLAFVNGIARFAKAGTHAHGTGIFSLGFLMGMFAMYFAVHVYRYK